MPPRIYVELIKIGHILQSKPLILAYPYTHQVRTLTRKPQILNPVASGGRRFQDNRNPLALTCLLTSQNPGYPIVVHMDPYNLQGVKLHA